MNEETAASRMEALGHSTRLSIYRLLVKAGDDGLIVGDIQKALDVPASTLSHHLAKLARVGLVSQGRRGREIYCSVDYDEMRALIGFLTEECCTGVCLEQSDAQDAA
ncbi:MAG: metalloregulator ArsR/SmtB family transcription factor [Rickettsiales bacterium]|jgi:ArsR family transcriptional regulator